MRRVPAGEPMKRPHTPEKQPRLRIFVGALAVVFLLMLGQLWRLQFLRGEYYQEAADVNRFRLAQNLAPRGVIYDRRGHLLVRNQPQIAVSVIPAYLPEDEAERKALLLRLAELLEMPSIGRALEPPRGLAPEPTPAPEPGVLDIVHRAEEKLDFYRPTRVKTGVPRDVALKLEEEHLDWPGVLVEVEPVREYLHGSLLSHVLGYLGPIPEERVEEYQARGYDPARNQVGITGLEYSFEDELHGRDGQTLVEVDIAGRETQIVGEPEPAIPGHNLRLTLDLGLQQVMNDALQKQLRALFKKQGVVIALNPQTGEILGMVSLPAYDNNLFTGGIETEELEALQKDLDRPLVNHGISGMFPPGSTYKIIVAAGALEEEVLTTDTRLYCGAIMWLPNRFYPEDPSLAQPFYCWIHENHSHHGSLNIVQALGQSCDIFFYQAGGGYRNQFDGLGPERLAYYAELFGMGARTGLDLPGEAAGLVPTAKWKRVNYSESWVTGDTYNMAIGQGFVLATPLQVLNTVATIANGGTLYRPQIVREVVDGEGKVVRAFAPDVIRQVPVSAEHLNIVRQGMRAAVSGAGATAWALKVPGIEVAGKTGTAEYFVDRNKDGLPDRDRGGHLPTHAWFTAFAPYENPEIALVVFVYGGGEGSATAVPIATEVLNYYFSRDQEGD